MAQDIAPFTVKRRFPFTRDAAPLCDGGVDLLCMGRLVVCAESIQHLLHTYIPEWPWCSGKLACLRVHDAPPVPMAVETLPSEVSSTCQVRLAAS